MASKRKASSRSGGGLPPLELQRIPDQDELPDSPVEHTGTKGNVIHIKGGQVAIENDDGSLELGAPAVHRSFERNTRFDENLAADPSINSSSIAADLLEGIQADLDSRREWEETRNRGREILGVKLEDASSSVTAEGTISQVRSDAMKEVLLQLWASSRGELLPAQGPVKVTDDQPPIDRIPGQPSTPMRSELADALEMDLNAYLTVRDKEYVPDFSRMLLNRTLDGIQFRKVYRCPLRRRPVSIWVSGDDMIVSNSVSHLSGAGRVTERFKMRQATVRRLQVSGHWLNVSLVLPVDQPTSRERVIGEIEGISVTPNLPPDHRHEIYECYCELDQDGLDQDENGRNIGFPLPYRVTIDKDSRQVLEIRRNWREGDEDFQMRRRHVKYGFVPGFGFYDWGLTHIIGNSQRASTAIERLLIDSGMYASMPGGLMAQGPGTRQRTNQINPAPGEFFVIQTGGMPIQDIAMPFPYKEPSGVLQAMFGNIEQSMRRIGGVLNMPIGEGRVGDVPVATMLAYVDAIQKVPSAVHKDDHAAQMEEFGLLKELFEEDPESLTRGLKRSALGRAYTAEELADQELVPAADPNVASHVHRLMLVAALVQLGAMPMFQGIANPRGLWDHAVKVLGAERPDEVTLPEQAPQPQSPPPQIVAAELKAQADQAKTQAMLQKAQMDTQVKREELAAKTAENADSQASEERRAAMKLEGDQAKAGASATGKVLDVAQRHAQHLNELGAAQDAALQPQQGGGITSAAGNGENLP